jgi:hypothetical protein
MMMTAMELEALTPEYLTAKVDTDAARKRLRDARSRFGIMGSVNESHATEVSVKSRSGFPMLTLGQTRLRGMGSGTETIYRRCKCDGFPPDACSHDPREAPHSETDLKDAEAGIATAETRLAAAETRLASIEPSFDCLAAAREAGSMYVWWPMDKVRDPRRYHWRGQPVSDADVVASGPHELRRMLNAGAIVEVDS